LTEPNEFRAALSTLVAFLTIGFLPLLVFVYDFAAPGDVEDPFVWSAVMTAIAFFVPSRSVPEERSAPARRAPRRRMKRVGYGTQRCTASLASPPARARRP
jgi:hypothetical protein